MGAEVSVGVELATDRQLIANVCRTVPTLATPLVVVAVAAVAAVVAFGDGMGPVQTSARRERRGNLPLLWQRTHLDIVGLAVVAALRDALPSVTPRRALDKLPQQQPRQERPQYRVNEESRDVPWDACGRCMAP